MNVLLSKLQLTPCILKKVIAWSLFFMSYILVPDRQLLKHLPIPLPFQLIAKVIPPDK